MREWIADATGLGALAGVLAVAGLLAPESKFNFGEGVFIYIACAAGALFIWHHQSAPKKPTQWLVAAVWSVVGAVVWYGFARLVARLVFGTSESEGSKFFDVGLALVIAPGLTIVALCGWVRALIK